MSQTHGQLVGERERERVWEREKKLVCVCDGGREGNNGGRGWVSKHCNCAVERSCVEVTEDERASGWRKEVQESEHTFCHSFYCHVSYIIIIKKKIWKHRRRKILFNNNSVIFSYLVEKCRTLLYLPSMLSIPPYYKIMYNLITIVIFHLFYLVGNICFLFHRRRLHNFQHDSLPIQ